MALVAAAAALATLFLAFRFMFYAPGLRTMIETVLTMCLLASAWWLSLKFRRLRRLSNLLSIAALLALAAQDLVFSLPAIGDPNPWSGSLASSGAMLVVATLFVAAAYAPRSRIAPRRAARPLLAVVTAGAAVVTVLVEIPFEPVGRMDVVRMQLIAVAVGLLLVAGGGFVRTAIRERSGTMAARLAAASILLASAWAYDLLAPSARDGMVSGRDCLRIMAYGLILTIAWSTRRHVRKLETAQAVADERRRLLRDLHDGLAQDLAFIAAHAETLAPQLGLAHPLAVAARRAVSVARGTIIDLSSSSSATVAEALQAVADELVARHKVRICVDASDDELPGRQREEVVRIAREAMVNAIEHGHARTIVTKLKTEGGHLALGITDDGCGFDLEQVATGPGSRTGRGYGLRAMHERAASLGGRLTLTRCPEGGTAVELEV